MKLSNKLRAFVPPVFSSIAGFLLFSNSLNKGTYEANLFLFLEVALVLWTLIGDRQLVSNRSVISAITLLVLLLGVPGLVGSLLVVHFGVITAILLAGYILSPNSVVTEKNSLLGYFTLFLLLKIVIELFSPNPNWFFIWSTVPVLQLSLSFRKVDNLGLSSIKVTILNLAILQSAIAVVEFMGSSLIFGEVSAGLSAHGFSFGSTRAQATLGHPLVLAIFLGFGIFISISSRNKSVSMKAFEVAALLLGIYASGSSSVLITVLLSCLVLVIRFTASRLRRGLLIMTGILTITVGYTYLESSVSAVLSDVSGQSALHRLNSLLSISNLVFTRDVFSAMLGSGQGSVDSLFSKGIIENSVTHAIDNQLVHSLATMGLIGLAVVLTVFGLALVRSWKLKDTSFPAIVFVVLMFFSFDLLAWSVPSLCIIVFLVAISNSSLDANQSSIEDMNLTNTTFAN